MIYEYKNDDTGEKIEVDFPMEEDKPQTIERDGVVYRRVWPFQEDSVIGIHIPIDFGSSDNKIDFTKRPSRRKQFF